jgi:hypothetical protein
MKYVSKESSIKPPIHSSSSLRITRTTTEYTPPHEQDSLLTKILAFLRIVRKDN